MFERINRAISNYLKKRNGTTGALSADTSGLKLVDGTLTRWSIAWDNVQRVTAFRYPGFVGDTVTLLIEAGEESQFINEEQDGWADVRESFAIYLPGAKRYDEWVMQVLAGGPDARVTVFERD